MFGQLQRDIVKVTMAVIGVVTLGNALANPSGATALIRAITDVPIRIGQSLRR